MKARTPTFSHFHSMEDDVNTFWTIFPYCYYVYEYDGMYKECCLRCQNCSRAFHAVEISPPPPDCLVKVDGVVEGYKCSLGYSDVTHRGGESESKKSKSEHVVVEISDEEKEENVAEEVNVEKTQVSGGVGNGEERKMRVKKAVGWNCTKIMGRGVRCGGNSVAMMRELSTDNKKGGGGGDSKVGDEDGGDGTRKGMGSGLQDAFDDILDFDFLEFDFEGDDIFASM